MSGPAARSLGRVRAIFLKELIQMSRDRLTFAIMIVMPIMQLVLFGFAINLDPRELPTAVRAEESTPITRALLQGFETSGYFDIIETVDSPDAALETLARGDAAFVITVPAGFTSAFVRGERPQLLIQADATDPAASSNALARAETIIRSALAHDLAGPLAGLAPEPSAFEVVIQPLYNPEVITQYNIVPGLLGVILTMTMVMITGMAMTREVEQGNMENLLAMPARPSEVMVGKIGPYIAIGGVQTVIVLGAAHFVFGVPFAGPLWVLMLGIMVFIVANLAVGFTFSTIARTQLQAMQMTFFFFLPSMLLSGFMFPFRGMPHWAQMIGEALPLTHFLRVVRAVMLKGAGLAEVAPELYAILAFTAAAGALAMARYRRTLD